MTSFSHTLQLHPRSGITSLGVDQPEKLIYDVPCDIDCITGIYLPTGIDRSNINAITADIQCVDLESGEMGTASIDVPGLAFRLTNSKKKTMPQLPLFTDPSGKPGQLPTFLMLGLTITITYTRPEWPGDASLYAMCKSFKDQARCRQLVRDQGFVLRHSTKWYDGSKDVGVVRLV